MPSRRCRARPLATKHKAAGGDGSPDLVAQACDIDCPSDTETGIIRERIAQIPGWHRRWALTRWVATSVSERLPSSTSSLNSSPPVFGVFPSGVTVAVSLGPDSHDLHSR